MMRGSAFRQTKRARYTKPSAGSASLVPVSKAKAEMNLARKVQQLSKFVKGLRPEIKYLDLSLSTTNITTSTGLTIHLTQIAQATAVNSRIGENVQVRWVEFHIEIPYSSSVAAVTSDNPTYRVYIVQDLQQVASTSPALSDLVDQPALPIVQLFNVSEQKRFRVLYDSRPQMLQIGTNAGLGANNSSIIAPGKWQLHLKKRVSIPVEFNSSSAAGIQKNGIYFMLATDMTTGVLDIVGSSRIGYTDA